ncbi:Transcription factor radR [Hyphodiscus hymeniophilus]|uniref:Transcription factor radR n=1 Tax=Hyphodiscus hymeniophilus TaxID=353542 RepID=A0A9P6VGR5_9HELO|nr:Transcription factor radR [Hyphodiscus hymeniophilus]
MSDTTREAGEPALQRRHNHTPPPDVPIWYKATNSTQGVDNAKGDQLEQNDQRHCIQSPHKWDTIVDTCFSGSEVPVEIGSQSRDWIFDFDSPVPAPESHDRQLNATFHGTIGSSDFAPWRVDAALPPLPGLKGSIRDTDNLIPPSSNQGENHSEPQILDSEEHSAVAKGAILSACANPPPNQTTRKDSEGLKAAPEDKNLQNNKDHDYQTRNQLPRSNAATSNPVTKLTEETTFDPRWHNIADLDDSRGRIQKWMKKRKYPDSMKGLMPTDQLGNSDSENQDFPRTQDFSKTGPLPDLPSLTFRNESPFEDGADDDFKDGFNESDLTSVPEFDTAGVSSSYAYSDSACGTNNSSAFSSSANPDQDWSQSSDIEERRRIQNRIAQRSYHKKLKWRLKDLERRAESPSAPPLALQELPENQAYFPGKQATGLVSNHLLLTSQAMEDCAPCVHAFTLHKSEATSIGWHCSVCFSGPHWHIFQCKCCELKTCKPCFEHLNAKKGIKRGEACTEQTIPKNWPRI